ncbi:MAG: TetR family transcriptional regulator [Myxococcota bacterium]
MADEASVRPRGRAAVRSALLTSAVQHPPDSGPLSVRDIARRAGVNHGQVQHLFSGKDGLYRAILEHLAQGLDAALTDAPPEVLAESALSTLLADRRFVRFLAGYLVEHPEGEIPQESFPVVQRLVAAEADEAETSRAELAALVAAGLGWAFFERWIRAAFELSDEEAGQVGEAILAPRRNHP